MAKTQISDAKLHLAFPGSVPYYISLVITRLAKFN